VLLAGGEQQRAPAQQVLEARDEVWQRQRALAVQQGADVRRVVDRRDRAKQQARLVDLAVLFVPARNAPRASALHEQHC